MKNKFNFFNKFIALLLLVSISGQNVAFAKQLYQSQEKQLNNEQMLGNVTVSNDKPWEAGIIHASSSNQDDQPPVTVTPTPVVTETPQPENTETLTPPIAPEQSPNDQNLIQSNDVAALSITYYVNIDTGNDTNPCTSVAFPCQHIQEAINKANNQDTILVTAGTYFFSTNPTPNVVIITKSLSLSGGWDPTFTNQVGASVVDGANVNNGILAYAPTIFMDGFVIQNGYTVNGGGIYIVNGNFTIKNSTLKNNHASGSGGGIFFDNGVLTVLNSTISGNAAALLAGGIYASLHSGSVASIQNSTIAYNTAQDGGGIGRTNGTFNIINTIIAKNISTNSSSDCSGTLSTANYSIIENMTGCAITTGGNNLHLDPQIESNLTGTMSVHLLLNGSPAINAGDPNLTNCPAKDEVGHFRPQGSSCDMGAVEFGSKSMHITNGNNQLAFINTAFAQPFVVYIQDENFGAVSGIDVTFIAPNSGASGVFSATGTNTTTITTNASGLATTSMFTANGIIGAFTVTASAPGYNTVNFQLNTNAKNRYVSPTGSDAAPTACNLPSDPCLTISKAIESAIDGNIIYVATGTYTGSGTEVVLINKSVTLLGGWDVSFTTQDSRSTLDGQGVRQGISIMPADSEVVAEVDHFIIQNGNSSSQGGGIYNRGGTLTLNNSIVSGNVSNSSGGGIANLGGALTINNTAISGNFVGQFGVSGGSGGGGISNTNIGGVPGGYVILNNSTVSGNAIRGYFLGSAIFNSVLPFEINNSTISGNTSANISVGRDNTSAVSIYNFTGTMTIKNSTISGNSYGGINSWFDTLTMQNSILANNTTSGFGSECAGTISSSGHNLIGNNSGCTFTPVAGDLVGTNVSPINPGLAPLQDNGGPTLTHGLFSDSPAIDTGGLACFTTDQRGTARPVGAACDIGAFEGQVPSVFVNISGNVGVAGAILNYTDGTPKTTTADGNGNYSITVLSGWSGIVTPSKAGHYIFFKPAQKTYNIVTVNQTSQNYTTALLSSLIKDPSFEAYTPNPYWVEGSTNFTTPLCTITDCGNGRGTALPRTGFTWGWFGGTSAYERATLAQNITIPSGFPNLKLQFYFWIGSPGAVSSTSNEFKATIDGVDVFSANATQQSSYPIYTPVLVDLSAFADGGSHLLRFNSSTSVQAVNFNLDDVVIGNVTFSDVLADQWALQFIERLYNAGITGGCSTITLKYCPDSTVTRAQMAVFLLKGMHGSSYTPPAISGNTGFADVAVDHWAAAWIKQLAAEGITSGCGAGNYCPDSTVTRAQMAIFLLKAKNGSSYAPPAVGGSTGFSDVAVNYWAAPFIKQLVADGITAGCGGGNYCPDSSVTRAQMAVFLVKTFNLP